MKHFLPLLCPSLLLASSWVFGAHAQSFAPAVTYRTGATPQTIVVADVNADDRPDLLTANSGSNSVGVLLNQAVAGTFPALATMYATGSNYPVGLAAGDLNGDGFPDLVTGSQFSQQVSVLLNVPAAPGTFRAATTYATGSDTRGVALGDFNGDGRLDIVATSSGSTVGVLLNSASAPGTFLPSVRYNCGGRLNESVTVGDVNGDGRPDIVVANNEDNTVSVLLNSATSPGTFGPGQAYGTGGSVPRNLALGDINQDGRLDIVVTNSLNSTIGVLLNNAATPGTFPASAVTYSLPNTGACSIAIGDVNGDRQADLVTANYLDAKGSTVGTLLQSATTFTPGPSYPSGSTGPHSVALGDLNGDGRLDVALCHLDGQVGVLLNTGPLLAAAGPTPAAGLSLYPNPTHQASQLSGLAAGSPVHVFDATGRLVLTAVAGATGLAELVFPPGLAPGTYLVRSGAQTLHLVVE